jgi:hypothetical protein
MEKGKHPSPRLTKKASLRPNRTHKNYTKSQQMLIRMTHILHAKF